MFDVDIDDVQNIAFFDALVDNIDVVLDISLMLLLMLPKMLILKGY
jgi:hypothetical protein